MLKVFRLSCLILLFSAIMFPASSYASGYESGSSQNRSIFSQITSIFTGNNGISDDLSKLSTYQNYNYNYNYNNDDDDDDDSYEIWKKWFCY